MAGAREPSMEDILASIKRVIAEEKEIRAASPPPTLDAGDEEDVLELDASMEAVTIAAPVDLGPPLVEEQVADSSRQSLETLASVAATSPAPPPTVNPLEEMVREMLRPILKQWLDDHLPSVVDDHVKREIHRITGRSV